MFLCIVAEVGGHGRCENRNLQRVLLSSSHCSSIRVCQFKHLFCPTDVEVRKEVRGHLKNDKKAPQNRRPCLVI